MTRAEAGVREITRAIEGQRVLQGAYLARNDRIGADGVAQRIAQLQQRRAALSWALTGGSAGDSAVTALDVTAAREVAG